MIIKSEKYIKTDFQNNNNKFWFIEVHDTGKVVTTYGRVGESGAVNTVELGSQEAALKYANSKIKGKIRDGRNGEIAYKPLNVIDNIQSEKIKNNNQNNSLEEIALKQINYDNPSKEIIIYLIQKNIHNVIDNTTMTYNKNSGLFETPCGIVTKDCIDQARSFLIQIGDYVSKNDLTSIEYGKLLNEYLMLIPQDVGRKLRPEYLYRTQQDIQKQYDILDSLEASLVAIEKSKTEISGTIVIEEKKIFNTELKLLDDKQEFNRINQLFETTKKDVHSSNRFKLKNIFVLKIDNVIKNFEETKKSINNIRELWHGSKSSNIISIMKGGLIIPPSGASYCTGRMFSDGIYFASSSTKSLNYSSGYWDNSRENRCFMFLADVALGKQYEPHSTISNFPIGYDSIFASPKNISSLINEEFVIPKTSQSNLKYLCEFEK